MAPAVPQGDHIFTGPSQVARTGGANRIGLTFQATETDTRKALIMLADILGAQDYDTATVEVAELVLAEVLNNVVEHAYGGTGGGDIGIRIDVTASGLDCRVTDQGKRLPSDRLPNGALASHGAARRHLPEGGFGWFLIHSLTENIRYSRQNGENRLGFTIPSQNHSKGMCARM